ncbi:hypothetical protein AM571_PC02030 (plasmid) [Rhizobium etli 8C-3]|uniref:Uncharacterized protein n=1 Tax=Rhizobium etli 8C-3 TaxID=538025 RepID=A0A1L5PHQ7_RHIET|nr:hypothetical protein AM571_PC02030 [Rhizobium etli 8C-3]
MGVQFWARWRSRATTRIRYAATYRAGQKAMLLALEFPGITEAAWRGSLFRQRITAGRWRRSRCRIGFAISWWLPVRFC